MVGDVTTTQIRYSAKGPEKAAEWWQGKGRTAVVAAEALHDDVQATVEVSMLGATATRIQECTEDFIDQLIDQNNALFEALVRL